MPIDKKIARMLIEEYTCIVVTQLLHNNYLSFRQLKCGESHMTYLPGIQLTVINSAEFQSSVV
jgi:hypothetical protein